MPMGRWRGLAAVAALACLTVAIYAPALRHGFVNFDDPEYVARNSHVLAGLGWEGVRWSFTTSYAANWHPLTWLSHMLDASLFGASAGGHHAVSVALQAANAALLFVALRGLTGRAGPSLLAAALFAAHPLRVESVAWVAERKDLLAGLFWLAGLTAWTRYARRPSPGRYAAVAALLALGLLSKPTMVAFPVVLLLLDWWPLGRWGRGAARLLAEKAPLLLLSTAAGAVTLAVQSSWGATDSADLAAPALRLANAAVSAAGYLGSTLWPRRLAVFYPHPGAALTAAAAWAAAAGLAAATAAALAAARRRPWLAVGWLWYLVALAPMSGLIQVGTQAAADRYTYLPLIGPVWAIALESAAAARRSRRAVAMLAAAGVAAVLALALAASRQLGHWRDSETLFRWTLEATGPGNLVAAKQLAGALAEQGRAREALELYARVLRARPGDALAQNNVGLILAGLGRLDESEAAYRTALRLRPALAEAHNNLGVVLGRTGRGAEALDQLRAALRLRPDYAEARLNLGSALALAGRTAEALEETRAALRLDPRLAMAHNNLGVYLRREGRTAEAAAEFAEALRLAPGLAEARANLEALRRGD